MEIAIDGQPLAGDGVVDLGGVGRVHMLASGDAFVIATVDMTLDGRPVVGRATRLAWGQSALLRAAGRRFALAWRRDGGSRQAAPWQECRLCFGGFNVAEAAATCTACDARFHAGCFAVLVDCQACGAAGREPTP